ncbi:MAG: DUF711 family protein [Deltaproteobacteria bacterium]|nr:DUF711 family protein [Deltaproteobacteria bacterium]
MRIKRPVFHITLLMILILTSHVYSQKAFEIRTITAGVNLTSDNWREVLDETKMVLHQARAMMEKEGFTLQGVRVATNPFPFYTQGLSVKETTDLIQQISNHARKNGFGLAIGPGIIDDTYDSDIVEKMVAILSNGGCNASLIIASEQYGIHHNAIKAAAEIMKRLSEIKTMANFSFAATANMPSEAPFFPGGYHNRSYNSFSIGTESAKLVMDVFAQATDITEAERLLFDQFEKEFQKIDLAGYAIQKETGWIYEGVDTSPAPMGEVSIGQAIENLLHAPFGSPGTLSICSVITNVIKGIDVKKAGYSGLMLPVMEDVVLAKRADEGWYGMNELLAYSSVCGTGLDVLPLPGDITLEQLEKVLLDVATLAVKLDKPLSARLIPVKGQKAGENAILDSDFLVPAKIFEIK